MIREPEPCARCFGEAEHDFGDIWLCTDCYYIAGSTCAGIPRPKKDEAGPAETVAEADSQIC